MFKSSFSSLISKYDPEKWPVMEFPDHVMSMNGRTYQLNDATYKVLAPALSKQVSIRFLVNEADLWVKSSGALASYVCLLLFALNLSAFVASICTLIFFTFWYISKSAFYSSSLSPILHWVSLDLIWFFAAILGITWLANQQGGIRAAVALGHFFIFRINIIQGLFEMLYLKIRGHYLHDRLLFLVTVKQSIERGLSIQATEKMQEQWMRRYTKWTQK